MKHNRCSMAPKTVCMDAEACRAASSNQRMKVRRWPVTHSGLLCERGDKPQRLKELSPTSWLHVKLTFLLCRGVLVLLILGHKIVHVTFGLRKLHLVHTLTRVPMKECLAAKHGGKVLGHALEHLLDRCGIPGKGNSHLEPLWWNVAHSRLDVVRNPLDEVRRILILHVEHLFIHFLGGHPTAEQSRSCDPC